MPHRGKSAHLTAEQFQTIVNTDHIRLYLIQAGLITPQGQIIPENEYRRGLKRRRQPNSPRKGTDRDQSKYSTLPFCPVTSALPRRSIKSGENDKQQQAQLKFFDQPRQASFSLARSTEKKTTNKERQPMSNRSLCAQNVLLRRAVSPKIVPAPERCHLKMKYYKADIAVEYDREWFEPDGDEIIIMQQHCGGENLTVFKRLVQHNETFQFQSRRHNNYPLALTFYVNGVIKNRLSVCCEWRCKDSVRIGGKRGLFGILQVDNAAPCRRCRFESRMKVLQETKSKSTNLNESQSTETKLTTERENSQSSNSSSTEDQSASRRLSKRFQEESPRHEEQNSPKSTFGVAELVKTSRTGSSSSNTTVDLTTPKLGSRRTSLNGHDSPKNEDLTPPIKPAPITSDRFVAAAPIRSRRKASEQNQTQHISPRVSESDSSSDTNAKVNMKNRQPEDTSSISSLPRDKSRYPMTLALPSSSPPMAIPRSKVKGALEMNGINKPYESDDFDNSHSDSPSTIHSLRSNEAGSTPAFNRLPEKQRFQNTPSTVTSDESSDTEIDSTHTSDRSLRGNRNNPDRDIDSLSNDH